MTQIDPQTLGDPANADFQVDRYPFYLLNRTAGRYNAIMEAALRPIGIDVPTWRVLMILADGAPRSVGHIAETAVINLSTMTRSIQRMARMGLVACAPRPGDRRVTEAQLTAAGKRALAQVRTIASGIFHDAVGDFDSDELDQLKRLLDRLYCNLSRRPIPTNDAPATMTDGQ
jgi:DNA-binding MarR family transcriptional regulator